MDRRTDIFVANASLHYVARPKLIISSTIHMQRERILCKEIRVQCARAYSHRAIARTLIVRGGRATGQVNGEVAAKQEVT